MNRIRSLILLSATLFIQLLTGCETDMITDKVIDMPLRNWTYVNKIKATVDIKNPAAKYNIRFKLRHTADYRYGNIYILFHLRNGERKTTRRYEYTLAQPDGQWNGSGSGNLYTYELPLLTGYSFGSAGKYELEIEQNMRDNPLKEISDAGIIVSAANP